MYGVGARHDEGVVNVYVDDGTLNDALEQEFAEDPEVDDGHTAATRLHLVADVLGLFALGVERGQHDDGPIQGPAP